MQSFPFTYEGKEYFFKKLDGTIKNYVTDRMTAARLSTLTRLLKEKLISAEEYKLEKASNIVRFHSMEYASDIMLPEFNEMLVRQLLNGSEAIDDDTLAKMSETPEFQTALENCIEDSLPKKSKAP